MSEQDPSREILRFLNASQNRQVCFELLEDGTSYSDLRDEGLNAAQQVEDFTERGLATHWRSDGGEMRAELTPMAESIKPDIDSILNQIDKLWELQELYASLGGAGTAFVTFEKLTGGEYTRAEDEEFAPSNQVIEHVWDSKNLWELVHKLTIRPDRDEESPYHKAMKRGPLEEAKFVHSTATKEAISNDRDKREQAVEHQSWEHCNVEYHVDERGEIDFEALLFLFEKREGESVVGVYTGDLFYEVSTDEAVDWARGEFERIWAETRPHEYGGD